MTTPGYKAEPILPGITKIEGLGGEYCYLVEGKNKALLIDTTMGIGNLKTFCQTLTSLPMTVVLTHGHQDHSGGVFAFDETWVHPADLAMMTTPPDLALFENYFKGIPGVSLKDLTPIRDIPIHPLTEGTTFDLGGRVFEVIHIPGHTRGSVCLFDKVNGHLFTGDGCNINTLLFIPGQSTSVEEYLPSVQKLKKIEKHITYFFTFHHFVLLPKTCIDDMIELCEEILAGKNHGEQSSHRGIPAILARPRDSRTRLRLDGRTGNIMYRQDGIFKQ